MSAPPQPLAASTLQGAAGGMLGCPLASAGGRELPPHLLNAVHPGSKGTSRPNREASRICQTVRCFLPSVSCESMPLGGPLSALSWLAPPRLSGWCCVQGPCAAAEALPRGADLVVPHPDLPGPGRPARLPHHPQVSQLPASALRRLFPLCACPRSSLAHLRDFSRPLSFFLCLLVKLPCPTFCS